MTLAFGGKHAHEVFGGLEHPRFELEHELGHGGFGVVWAAWDKEHAQRVALKVLHRNDAQALRRFKGEFRTLANLTHDNLVSLYELHQDDQRWFFTMELVDGTTFYDWIVAPREAHSVPGTRAPSVALTRPARPRAKGASPTQLAQLRAPSDDRAAHAPGPATPAPATPAALFMATTPAEGGPEGVESALALTSPAPEPARGNDARRASTSTHPPTPLAVPEPFLGIEIPDAETYALWDATRPAAASALPPIVDFVRLRAAFDQLAQALAWLHGSGHLHRDVKPSNVLVTKTGLVKVLDFGLVTRLFAGDLTPADALVGTPVYMAPELCAGLSASPASDWYSLGVMLYTILTGKLPFNGEMEQVILAKQAFDARPPRDVVTGPIPEDLDALCTALLAKNPVERPDVHQLLAAFGSPSDAAVRTPDSAVYLRPHAMPATFVGRSAEVSRLAALTHRPIGDGEALVVLVEGLSGVGKTSLVEHLLREAETRGDLVLRSRCFERGSVRFKALDGAIDDLARHLAQLSKDEIESFLPHDPWDRGALARLFPVLPRIAEGAHVFGDDVDPIEVKRRAFKALRGLLTAVAEERRVHVEIDDAQWSDDDSLAPLMELFRSPSPDITWFIAYRSDEKEQSSFLRGFGAAALPLVTPAHRVAIQLGPLPDDEAFHLAAERLGTSPNADGQSLARARAIAHEAGGHPLLIDELARASASHFDGAPGQPIADRLTALLGARIQALPPQARTIIELVAIAAEPVDVRVVRAATGADQRDLNLLITERLIRSRPGNRGETVVAWHDRVRETATAAVDGPTRARRHRALAEAAERTGDADPFFLHVHWKGAGETERAATCAIAAAEAAQRAFAFDRAAELYTTALELAPTRDPALIERLAEAKKNAGRGIEAGRTYLEAAAAARGPDEVRRLEIAAAEQFLFAGGLAEGQAVITKVLARAGVTIAQSIPSLMGSLLWQSLRLKLRGERYEPRDEASTPPEARALVDTLWSATIGMSMAHPLTSTTIQKRHLRMALDLGEPLRIMRAMSIELAFSGLPGGPPGSKADRTSKDLSARAHVVARSIDHPYPEAFITMSDGATHWLRGRWREALDAMNAALAVFETACVGVAWEKDTARVVVLAALQHRGALRELRDQLERALSDATQRGDLFLDTQLRSRFVPAVSLMLDRPDEVDVAVDGALTRWAATGYQVVHFYGWVARIDALLYQRRGAEARALFDLGRPALKRSFILMGQYYRIQYEELAGRVALAVGDTRGALRSATRLAKERMGWASALADLLRGLAQRDPASLASAVQGFDAVDMRAHRAAADHAHALVVGDAQRADTAKASMAALGAVAPERYLAMISSH